jgi:transcription termination/antitermination protein NusG
MPEERNRPHGSKPDTASLIQRLFRDEPEGPQAEPEQPEPAQPPTAESPVGVLVPPAQDEDSAPAVEPIAPAGSASPAAEDAQAGTGVMEMPVTSEGLVEAPPSEVPTQEADEAVRAARGARWFVIHTYSGYENKVRSNLERRVASMGMQDKIFRILVPTEDEIEIKDGKRRIAKKKVFPGYVLVEMIMNDDSWYVVRNTPGVTGFVGSGTKPLPLQDREVKAILKQLGDETPKFRITYQKGSAVRINSGPFMDFSGVVDEILPEKEKVRVLVSIFGRETPVELDFAQVEKI